jgi:hypothetical protein
VLQHSCHMCFCSSSTSEAADVFQVPWLTFVPLLKWLVEYNIVRLRCRAHRQGSKFGAADTNLQRAPASIPKVSQFETDLEHISHIRSKYVKYCQRPSSIVKNLLNIFLQKSVMQNRLPPESKAHLGRETLVDKVEQLWP